MGACGSLMAVPTHLYAQQGPVLGPAPMPMHLRHNGMMMQREVDIQNAALEVYQAKRNDLYAQHTADVQTDDTSFYRLPAKQARETNIKADWAVRYEDRYHLPSRALLKESAKHQRESAFDCSNLRGQLRMNCALRSDGLMVPKPSSSATVKDGLAACSDEWRSQDYHDYMRMLQSSGGPQPGMPRATNQGPLTAAPAPAP